MLWLEDLERYLEGPAVSRGMFAELGKHEPRVVVLATLTLTSYERLRSGEGGTGRPTREILEILDLFEQILLPNTNSRSELEEARQLYPSQRFVAGIGEHFAAAHELVEKFKTSLEHNPHGFCVAMAALDWRRAGMSRAIADGELRELYAVCLRHFHPLERPDDGRYWDGLDWAREPLQSRAALLMPATAADGGAGGFQIFDYVRDWADGAGAGADPGLWDVLDSTWPFVVERAEPEEALAVGLAAYTRGKNHHAAEAFAKAAGPKTPRWRPGRRSA